MLPVYPCFTWMQTSPLVQALQRSKEPGQRHSPAHSPRHSQAAYLMRGGSTPPRSASPQRFPRPESPQLPAAETDENLPSLPGSPRPGLQVRDSRGSLRPELFTNIINTAPRGSPSASQVQPVPPAANDGQAVDVGGPVMLPVAGLALPLGPPPAGYAGPLPAAPAPPPQMGQAGAGLVPPPPEQPAIVQGQAAAAPGVAAPDANHLSSDEDDLS